MTLNINMSPIRDLVPPGMNLEQFMLNPDIDQNIKNIATVRLAAYHSKEIAEELKDVKDTQARTDGALAEARQEIHEASEKSKKLGERVTDLSKKIKDNNEDFKKRDIKKDKVYAASKSAAKVKLLKEKIDHQDDKMKIIYGIGGSIAGAGGASLLAGAAFPPAAILGGILTGIGTGVMGIGGSVVSHKYNKEVLENEIWVIERIPEALELPKIMEKALKIKKNHEYKQSVIKRQYRGLHRMEKGIDSERLTQEQVNHNGRIERKVERDLEALEGVLEKELAELKKEVDKKLYK